MAQQPNDDGPEKHDDPVEAFVRRTRLQIARAWAARIAIVGALVWGLSSSASIVSAVQDLLEAWELMHPDSEGEHPYTPIRDERDRYANLITLRDRLQQRYSQVAAIAYYVLEQDSFGVVRLRYVISSGGKAGSDRIYFEPLIRLSSDEISRLRNHECIYHQKLGAFIDQPQSIAGIVCPTFSLVRENGLWMAQLENASAIALTSIVNGDEKQMLSTDLWQASPSLEPLFKE